MKARGGLGVTEEVGEGDDVLDETGMEVGAEAEGRGEDDVDGLVRPRHRAEDFAAVAEFLRLFLVPRVGAVRPFHLA